MMGAERSYETGGVTEKTLYRRQAYRGQGVCGGADRYYGVSPCPVIQAYGRLASRERTVKTDGMNTVSSQSDLHSLSCIAMQRAENNPDASFLFFRGKTSIFVVSASESRSARFSGAYN